MIRLLRRGVLLRRFNLLVGVVLGFIFIFQASHLFTDDADVITPLRVSLARDQFLKGFLRTRQSFTTDIEPIRDLCRKQTWQEGLVFECSGIYGGHGNVRTLVLNCVRFAIEAGAALVIPRIVRRSSWDLSKVETKWYEPLDFMYDVEHFNSTLSKACPQLTLHDTAEGALGLNATNRTHWVGPSLTLNAHWIDPLDPKQYAIERPKLWNGMFNTWLANYTNVTFTPQFPQLVYLHRPIYQWPTDYDNSTFVAAFGRILRPRPDLRRLAGLCLWQMTHSLGLRVTPNAMEPNQFLGMHLRTDADAIAVGWPNYTMQASAALSHALNDSLQVVHVSTGNKKDLKRFQASAEMYNITVTHKRMLLTGMDRRALDDLSWDQQALIDYEILLHSSKFSGLGMSSFSYNIAVTRRQWAETQARAKQHPSENVTLGINNEFNHMCLPLEEVFGDHMWP